MILTEIWAWLSTSANWSGDQGIWHRLVEHLWYSGLTLLIAGLIAIPLGIVIAHSGRATWVITLANALRAVPTLGLLFVMSLWLGGAFSGASNLGFVVPSVIVLVILAIPPLLAGAYSGVREIDPAARDAARGMGMTGGQVLRQVEVPCALPLIFSGVRSASLQVIATATIAASIGLGGLGRYIIDGIALSDFPQMVGGSLIVAALALIVDLLTAALQRFAISPGLTGRRRRSTGPVDPSATPGPDREPGEQLTDPTSDDLREQARA